MLVIKYSIIWYTFFSTMCSFSVQFQHSQYTNLNHWCIVIEGILLVHNLPVNWEVWASSCVSTLSWRFRHDPGICVDLSFLLSAHLLFKYSQWQIALIMCIGIATCLRIMSSVLRDIKCHQNYSTQMHTIHICVATHSQLHNVPIWCGMCYFYPCWIILSLSQTLLLR
jgi:hypothetical protein